MVALPFPICNTFSKDFSKHFIISAPCGILHSRRLFTMYISIKMIRIIVAALIAGVILINVSISHSTTISDEVKEKVGAVSFIAIILLIILKP